MVGFWATLSLNMPDFTRFSAGQRAQVIGQVVGLPTTMTVFAAMGVAITSASTIIFGAPIWDPVTLVGKFHNPWVVAIAMFTVIIATLSVNIAANVVSPANDFSNMWPRVINFKTGGLITGVLGILMQPWHLLADANSYIFDWLLLYSGGLGSIGGVLIADYWLVRRGRLNLPDLYATRGVYTYVNGWNWVAVLATLLGCFAAWGGKKFLFMAPLVPYGWFVGFAVAFLVHWAAMSFNRQTGPQSTLAPAD
jgi:NCS1 family nucleobase:cation symporter-1